jgi:hypothetical protein
VPVPALAVVTVLMRVGVIVLFAVPVIVTVLFLARMRAVVRMRVHPQTVAV